jgi:hypothetical protein
MPCDQLSVTSTAPAISPATHWTPSTPEINEPVRNDKSIFGWNGFTPNQLHRIVISANDNLKLCEVRRHAEKKRLFTALQEIKSRIASGEPVESRETFKDYLELVEVTLTKSERKKFGVKEEEK